MNSTRQPAIVWGPGLSIVLRQLPGLVLPPAVAIALATLGLEHVKALKEHGIERPVLAIALWALYKFAVRTASSLRRRQARRQFGPDVLDIPAVKLKWPANADFIPLAAEARDHGYVNDALVPYLETHGNIYNLPLFGQDFIFTIEPEHIKSVLTTDFSNFIKGNSNHEKLYSLLGEGVFNVDGDMWKFHRSMTRPYFSRERITHFEMFARHSDAAISKMLSRLSETSPDGAPLAVDFQELVSRFTMDSASEFLFGHNVHSLDEPLAYPHGEVESAPDANTSAGFARAFGSVQAQAIVRFAYGPMWPFFEMFWDRTGKDMREIDAFMKPILHAKLEQKKRGGSEKGAGDERDDETLIDHLVRLTDDEKLIKDELFNILVAGRDTTATTLTFTCYMLATHPVVLAKLRAEILSVVGASAYPTFDDFREMKYMRAVINEVLRLYPPVPMNQRECVNDTVLKSGGKQYFVPAGAMVMYSVLFMHTRKDLWGPDADIFDPERWLDERHKKYVLPNPFIFLPFNAGPRICLGQQFAYNEASFFLTRLLQRVENISLAPDAQPAESRPPVAWAGAPGRKGLETIWPKAHLTMYSFGGLWVRAKEASN